MIRSGIYCIENSITNIRYIGSSQDIPVRFSQHKRMLKKGSHHSIFLQRAWDKYGSENFKFKTLAILELSELLPTEQRLLDLEHLGNTYNIAKDAVSWMKDRKHSDETKRRMSTSRLGNKSRTGVPSHWVGKSFLKSIYLI